MYSEEQQKLVELLCCCTHLKHLVLQEDFRDHLDKLQPCLPNTTINFEKYEYDIP